MRFQAAMFSETGTHAGIYIFLLVWVKERFRGIYKQKKREIESEVNYGNWWTGWLMFYRTKAGQETMKECVYKLVVFPSTERLEIASEERKRKKKEEDNRSNKETKLLINLFSTAY